MKRHIRERLRVLAGERPRWGYRRLHVLLKREVGVINHKRVYRLYREEGLLMRRRKRKRVAVPPRGVAGADLEAGRSLEYGLHAGCAHRWTALSYAQHPRSGDEGVPGD